jgi:ADP-ribose pyrophosphatase
MADFTEKTLSSETIYNGKIINVQLDEVELPNGKTSKRELVYHPGAVAVIALTKEGRMLMVRQFRKPLERSIVEVPAGKLEKGENPEECARRELEEETGYRSENMSHVASFYTSPGFSDELIHLYFTDELTEGQQNTDDDEFVELMAVTLEEALELVRQKEIYDAKTVYAVQYWQLRKNLRDD